MQYLNTFILSMIGVFAAAIAGGIVIAVKGVLVIKKDIAGMVNNGRRRAAENQVQFQILRAHGKAIKATLEVVSQTKNNGNVSRAFKSLEEADKSFNDYSDNFVKYDCKEKEK